MNAPEQNKMCAEIAPLLVFYACDEVDKQERVLIETHLSQCSGCQTQLKEEREFREAISATPQTADRMDTAGVLLAQCRSELSEKLDDFARPLVKEKAPAFAWLKHWMALHPAWSGALLVLLGLLAGVQTTQWFTGRNDANALDHAVNVRPEPRITQEQLGTMALAGINMTPSADGANENVRLQMSAEQPVVLNGNLDDKDVRQVLTYVVANGERFESGVRLDCLEALRARAQDLEVRKALLSAALKDRNPAVRIKALESLRDSLSDRDVRATLLQALQQDSNPGVRVEAVNLLVGSLEKAGPPIPEIGLPHGAHVPQSRDKIRAMTGKAIPDESLENVIRALEELQHRDPSRYVRLRSAAALRGISARNDQ